MVVTFACDWQFALGNAVHRGLDGTQTAHKQWEAKCLIPSPLSTELQSVALVIILTIFMSVH
jgi:hypothetical protein